jgi:hypothetical protein
MSKTANNTAAGVQTFSNTTQSTDKDTGAVILQGGMGVEKNINAGGAIAAVGAMSAASLSTSGNITASGSVSGSNLSGANTGDVTLGAFGSTPDAKGASLSGQILTMQPADGSNPGLVSAATQSFGGKKTFSDGAIFNIIMQAEENLDSTTTGGNASVPATAPFTTLSNASLTSIGNISGGAAGKLFILGNRTGAAITVKNDATGTAADRIVTGTGADLTLEDNATIWVAYDSNESRWMVVGGSGGGGGSFTTSNQQTLAGAGTITIDTAAGFQMITIAGNGAAVTLSSTPFGATPPNDGGVIHLIGAHDTNTVSITANDAADGCVGNFSTVTLAKYEVAKFQYSATFDRYVLI